jgi:hypothetical protein
MRKSQTPSKYTAAVADYILDELANGRTLRAVCRDADMPSERSVRTWAIDNREGFGERYTHAREIGYHAMFDEMFEIADDATNDWMIRDGRVILNSENVARSKLRNDTRKWALSKALPKIYGDKLTHDGAVGVVVNIAGRDTDL